MCTLCVLKRSYMLILLSIKRSLGSKEGNGDQQLTRTLKQSIFSERQMVQIPERTLCHLLFNMYVAASMVTDAHTDRMTTIILNICYILIQE